jgi:putative membrane protein
MPDDFEKYQEERTLLAEKRTALANERNRLSNERTFLAWVRTGLATVGGGVAIMRLLSFENLHHRLLAQLVGAVLVILGVVIFILSSFDYASSYKKMKLKNGFISSMWWIISISVVLCILSMILLFITFDPVMPT